jgi:flagellar biosynthesis protein FlhG
MSAPAKAVPPAIKAPPLRSPKRITIASGKGGVGKTWTAVTLAQAFALLGERVLLVDGDLGLANVDVQLGIEPKADLAAVMAGQTNLAGAVAPYAGGPSKAAQGGFDVLPGRSGAGTLAGLPDAELLALAKGLVALEASYDRVLVDLGAGLDKVVTTLCTADQGSKGHAILVVLTAEPTSLTDAYAFIKVIRMHAPKADLRVVVNRAAGANEGKRTHLALSTATQNFLGFAPPLAGIIPDDSKVADAIRHQTSLLLRHPQSKAGASVIELAKALARGPG